MQNELQTTDSTESPIAGEISVLRALLAACARTRNHIARRATTEPLTAADATALADLAVLAEAEARAARKRYRKLEATVRHFCPSFDIAKSLDWQRAAGASLKLSCASLDTPVTLDQAIDLLTADELDSYAQIRRLARRAVKAAQHARAHERKAA